MAVPKKRKNNSATKRQRNSYLISQWRKIKGMVDRAIRHEKNQEKIGLNEGVKNPSDGKTVIAA